jgi:hypothetical protein
MSQRTETKKFEHESTIVVELRCDLCGTPAPRPEDAGFGRPWPTLEGESSCYEGARVTLEFAFGYQYPEGGCQNHEAFDICPTCWRTHLRPWIEAQGAKVRAWEAES